MLVLAVWIYLYTRQTTFSIHYFNTENYVLSSQNLIGFLLAHFHNFPLDDDAIIHFEHFFLDHVLKTKWSNEWSLIGQIADVDLKSASQYTRQQMQGFRIMSIFYISM